MSTEIARRTDALVGRVVKKLAKESPRLADLNAEELRALARVVVAEELRDELKARVRLERIDHEAERQTFLKSCSRTRSPHTRRAYAAGLARLKAWCSARSLDVPALTPAQADDWINDLRAEGRSAASVGLDVAGASSYFTWLARRHPKELAVNPFRGTKARPPAKARRELAVPSAEEIDRLIAEASGELRAAVVVMARLGLRVGALPTFRVNGERFTATSKGRVIDGSLPPEIREEIEHAGLPLRGPFAERTADQLRDRFRYLVSKLYTAKALRAPFSVNDLRHAFAVSTYTAGKDLYAVSRALGHADINMTARYLRSLGQDA